ncbi:MAG TPA: hypothetical protein VIV57_19000 [Anaeromyxobacter sp.]
MSRARAALALAAACALGAGAGAEEPVSPRPRDRIALERLRAPGVSAALVEVVEERICAALGEASGADVVCPADVAAAAELARQSNLLGECKTEDCLKRVDRVRAADRRVTGAIDRSEGGLVLSLQLEGPAGAGPRRVERLPEDLDALVARIPVLVKKLFP